MASQNVMEITDQNFENEVLKSQTPVVVDFWAEWCGPCRMLTPIIDKLATQYAGKVKVGKVDTEVNRDIAMKFGITSIPTVMFFKGGTRRNMFIGFRQEPEIKKIIDELLAE
ncbi:MAG TPA: thioredoxin [Humisphaera sp.]|jgi:thioredoxin 1|nr:thioredoxin [Humisphaera sp.]